ncbi:MAG: xanthine dehydrogenase family protein molybdopterin-binding subunit [Hyphomicrobiaceae bacterium]|nr:xanthine dehydrogenase family protein molybdopterin-binding subunit [Hyphomicrobiaceae bacterium]
MGNRFSTSPGSHRPEAQSQAGRAPDAFGPERAHATTSTTLTALDRRSLLRGLAGAGLGLVIGVQLPRRAAAQSGAATAMSGGAGEAVGTFAPNAFIRIAPDSTVTVLIKHIEFGQGPYTGLATLVAEELDADWEQMRAEAAPADTELYKNLAFGVQGTGGSTAMANSYEQMRKAGATARAMLVAAASAAWGVPAAEIAIESGSITHKGTGKAAKFGEFADAASRLEPPENVTLKDPKAFRLIGTDLPKLDTSAKTTGAAMFTIDVDKPGMLTVLIAHPPAFGATVKAVDDKAALAVPGVVAVKTLPQGVAVYAEKFWAAKTARDVLDIAWDTSKAETRSTSEILTLYTEAAAKPGRIVKQRGAELGAANDGSKTIEAEYVFPYLAHAPMEPLDCVIEADADGCQVMAGSQMQTIDQAAIAQVLGLRPETVSITTMLAGGSFGRRATPNADIAVEAAHAAKAFASKRPLKLLWTREDDIRGGRYRPAYVHRLKGRIDAAGNIVGWQQTIVGQSIMEGTPFASMMKDGIDPTMIEGAEDLPYVIPNFQVDVHKLDVGIPVLWWRSVGHSVTGFSTETFIDELLALAGKDAVEGRLAMLGENTRHAGVLREVARMADWGGKVPEGRARGVAVHKSFNSYVAQIAEVSVGKDSAGKEKAPRVHKVWCAVDCGIAVNPNIVRAQMEGGIGYGLGAALYNAITLSGGKVQQGNFDTYRSLRINEMPDVEVSIIKSGEAPTGVGEPGVPPIAPAVANAWAKLTGTRVRKLPFVDIPA